MMFIQQYLSVTLVYIEEALRKAEMVALIERYLYKKRYNEGMQSEAALLKMSMRVTDGDSV